MCIKFYLCKGRIASHWTHEGSAKILLMRFRIICCWLDISMVVLFFFQEIEEDVSSLLADVFCILGMSLVLLSHNSINSKFWVGRRKEVLTCGNEYEWWGLFDSENSPVVSHEEWGFFYVKSMNIAPLYGARTICLFMKKEWLSRTVASK